MNSNELLTFISAGQKVFYDLDIEGNLINEDLSGLSFENCFFLVDFYGSDLTKTKFEHCNLKTCIFNYCLLEDAVFNSNSVEAADFKYTRFKNITFINNTSYGSQYTVELLEDLRYDSHPGFHITRVKAGWFEVVLADKAQTIMVTASAYLGHDAPLELLVALNDLCMPCPRDITAGQSKIKWLCWDDEPGAWLWKLERLNDLIKVAIYTAKKDSWEINRHDLEREAIYSKDFESEGDFFGFIKEIVKSYEIIGTLKNEQMNYENQWGSFPGSQWLKLKSCIRSHR